LPAVETTPARPLPTIWELPDDLWEEIEPMLDCFYPPARTGRPRADLRLVLDGIIHWLRSAASGVAYRSASVGPRPFTAGFSDSPPTGSWRRSGRIWCASARSLELCAGSGRPPTA
jgi:hypothetical protein